MIKDIKAYHVFDSRGTKTISVELTTDHGIFYGSAPGGKSVGKFEAKTMDVERALHVFGRIKENFISLREEDFELLDDLIVQLGGESFVNIGSQIGFALSSALLKACTKGEVWKFFQSSYTFPFPLGNVVGGGAHGGGTDIQEFLIIPVGAKSIAEAIETNIQALARIKKILRMRGMLLGKNDENAWIARLDDLKTLDLVSAVAEELNARVGMDMAASELYSDGKYNYMRLGKKFDSGEQLDFVRDLISKYKLAYVEDPFQEDDFESFAKLTKRVKKGTLICGDDLFATNTNRLRKGSESCAGNAIIIKPNQAGTIGLAIKTANLAKELGYVPVISHRSGETTDWIIADLAIGLGTPLIKTGVVGGERLAKLNRLIWLWDRIEKPSMAKLPF